MVISKDEGQTLASKTYRETIASYEKAIIEARKALKKAEAEAYRVLKKKMKEERERK